MGRPPCCDKANVKRGLWTAEEDAKILAYVSTHGTGNWTQVPKKAGLNRCGKSCRLRWTNYLRPDLKHEEFTEQEEELIIQYHAAIGSRWSLIAKQLPGRTDNDVKNYWNTKLKKKLSKIGIDPVTHKPFTKIFSDFQSINCVSPIHQLTLFNKNSSFIEAGIQTVNTNEAQFQDVYSNNINCLLQQEPINHYMDELSLTSSSSSSSSISNKQSTSSGLVMPTAYNWIDQSFGQPLQTTDIKEEEQNLLAKNQEKNGASYYEGSTETIDTRNNCENSSVNSFVKTLLDRDSEMQLSFPIFGDILDY